MIALLILLFGGGGLIGIITAARMLEAQAWRNSLVAYRLSLPQGLSPDDVATWLGHVVSGTHARRFGLIPPPPAALEVVATADGIRHMLLLPERTYGTVLAGLRAAMPGVRFEQDDDYLSHRPALTMATEARLTSLLRPLAHDRAQAASTALLAALSPLSGRDTVVLQWIFVGSVQPRPTSPRDGAYSVLAALGGSSHPAPDAEKAAAERRKHAEPMLAATLRLGVAASTRPRTTQIFGWVWGTLRGLNTPGVSVVRRMLPEATVVRRIAQLSVPIAHWPMFLNVRELTGLLGLPLGEVALPGLPRASARQLPPPVTVPGSGSVVALSTYPGMTGRPLAIATADRLRHTWVIGPTGVGKSTLLAGQIIQDIEMGRSVVVIDPKGGDLITDVLDRVPDRRRSDVIVIDPSATDQPVGLNLLDMARGEHAGELAVDNLVHLMGSLWHSSWGPRTSDVLRNALLTLTHTRAADGSKFTLVELPELLLNPSFRRFVLSQPGVPPTVRPFWEAFEAMSDGERAQVIGPSLNKLRSLTTRTALRLMLGQSAGIRIDEVFTRRRIVLVSLPAGIIGSETATLIGSLVLAALWQATLARVAVPAGLRHPVMVYLDEFQNIVRLPLDLADMLAQARGLGVGLILAHQYLGQLTDDIRTAVLGTARTQICFQVEYDDAKTLAHRFAPLTQADLSGLPAYEIAMRPCVGGATLGPVTGKTLPLPPVTTDGAALAAEARQRLGRPRTEVEAAIAARIAGPTRTRTGRQTTGGEA
ncbi:type IV secretory system conjugative DNA transfer family protein [Catenulispora rubra]|uniref:type IV secretory system conjugative DNA transfer family protein n=1 Tax=Catenulispora rubra TaxID=280293 RepID=UPI0018924F6D|nr:TraM recognition domain-containing protein [Catenulispora rubra]